MASLIRVDSEQIWVELSTQPPVGAILDVGFPVVVTDSKQVAGGGMLITAERINDNHDRGGASETHQGRLNSDLPGRNALTCSTSMDSR